MSKGTPEPTEEVDQTTIEDESLGTAQEAIPFPWFAGKVAIAARYITPIYGQRAQQAPKNSSAKK